MNQPIKLYSLQLLRFIAALFVLLFHVNLMPSGYKGVDIFFVISGFVIYYSTLVVKHKGPVKFFVNRFTKIYILYWLVLAVAYILFGFHFNKTTLPTIFLLPNHVPVLTVSWSLSYELYFYIFFAAIIFILPAKLHKYLFGGLLVITTLITLLNLTPYTFKGSFINFFFGQNFWEFLLGVLACYISNTLSLKPKTAATGALAAFSAIAFVSIPYAHSLGYVIYGLLSFLLVLSIVLVEKSTSIFNRFPALVAALGDASYAMYLTNFIFIDLFVPVTLISKTIIIAGVICSAIFINKFVETPLLKITRRALLHSTKA